MTNGPDRGIERELAALRRTLRRLRRPGGCPWDREQDLDDMIGFLIEESYELLDAERRGDWRGAEEELGDVVFILIFIHELLRRRRRTPLAAVVAKAHAKIVSRHPHVFGPERAENCAQSLAAWERAKRAEKGRSPAGRRILDGVPAGLPPLRRAAAVQRKAAGVGFDWPDHRGILDKLSEETAELEREIERGSRTRIKDEIGDMLFTVVNLSRALRVDPESVLAGTTAKFTRRFDAMEAAARRRGRTLSRLSLDEMERLWRRAKRAK